MAEQQELIPVYKTDLVGKVAELFAEGHRLVQIGCTTLSDGYEMTYSFDRDYRLTNLRVMVKPDDEVPSITAVYGNAFLYENEIHDLFGVPIRHINVDYGGTLYRTSIPAPFGMGNVKLPEPPKQKPPVTEKGKSNGP
jgi:ech hydrogenase subunit D